MELRKFVIIRRICLVCALVIPTVTVAFAQSEVDPAGQVLNEEILPPSVALFQLQQYILGEVSKPPAPGSAADWTAEASRLRPHLLNDIVFHGWPREWVDSSPKFEDLGAVEHTGSGYRMRKLRYEIIPGFYSTAILYEPENLNGKVPAILNVHGHVGAEGKAIEYEQKRCINFAKRGIVALSLEWLGTGELSQPGNEHSFGAHLDLVGANEVGLFYLCMRRGLDFLYNHPKVDQKRVGVTGLSGGGWQTIILSSLDDRVAASVPVAGFSSISSRVEVRMYGDLGDVEQYASDLFQGRDCPLLVALRAPKPTLLVYNAEDNCCFRAPVVKPLVFDAVRPIFKLYGEENNLRWHENRDPATHNYQVDNRIQAYRFFSQAFGMPVVENEIPSDSEIKSYAELEVGIPKENLTIQSLAQKLGREISRTPIPSSPSGRSAWVSSETSKLKGVIRFKPVEISRVWSVAITKNKGIETKSYLFQMGNGLSAEAVWSKAIASPDRGPATIVLNDKGMGSSAKEVSDRVNRGEQVLALDLVFTGAAWKGNSAAGYEQMLHGLGDRPLGLEVAQLLEISHWLRRQLQAPAVRLECTGIRNQVAAEIAAAVEPNAFSEVVIHEGMSSLGYLLDVPVPFDDAPELFCLDLYKDFDLDRFVAMAAPTRVTTDRLVMAPDSRGAGAKAAGN